MTDVEKNQKLPVAQAARGNFLETINRAINGTMERIFEALGRLIGRRPVMVIIGAMVVAAALGSGVHRIKNEERGEKLWVPSNNDSQKNNDFVTKYFPSLARFQLVYLEREDGSDILTPEALNKALSIHNQILALRWNNTKEEKGREFVAVDYLPATQMFKDLCFNKDGSKGADDVLDCSMQNPLAILGYDSSAWATRESLLEALSDRTAWDRSLTGPGFVLDDALGGLERDSVTGAVTGAKVLSLSYLLASNKTMVQEQKDDVAAEGWEQAYLDLMEEIDEADTTWHVRRLAARSFDDEFGSTIEGDLALLQIAIVCIIVYTYLAISNPRDGIVGSRLLLTLGGIVNIGLAVLAAYGLAAYIGLLFTPLMSILPFIMLGVGVDGMFVLQSALDATNPKDSIEKRMGETMRDGGVSVAVASITNFFAFIIGSNTSLPALSAFSIYAALGLLFDLLLQITFFAAIMALDKKRQDNRRWDIILCCTSDKRDAGYFCGAIGGTYDEGFEGYRVAAMKWLGKQYTKPSVKGFVISMYLGLLAAGIYGTAKMKVEADVADFIPAKSYLRDWYNTLTDNFGATGTDVNLYWVNDAQNGPVDFSNPAVQTEMDNSLDLFRENEYVVADTVSSWWEELKEVNGSAPGLSFYPSLRQFLISPTGARYNGDIAFVDEDSSEDIFAARSSFQWKYVDDTQEQINAMDSMRETTKLISEPLGTRTFVHSAEFLDIEQYKSIGREALMNIGLGFAMIAVVVLLLVANPVAAVLTFLCVASSIIELVGFMYFRGSYIDSVSVIFLVISLGLAVDYSVHVSHGYLATRESDPEIRLQKTMSQTGVAVINGAISTLIAALCLSGSGSYVFVTFFYALLFIVILGAIQGLVVLPVLLDIFRPAPHAVTSHAVTSQDEELAN